MENDFLELQKLKPDIRELTLEKGIDYPSDEELLMLILNKGTKDSPVEVLAHKALNAINTSSKEDLVPSLTKIDGIGLAKALTVAAAVELGRRRNAFLKAVINKPKDILPYIQHYSIEKREHFVCVSLNGCREILGIRVISIGTVSRTLVHPREVFSDAIKEKASGVICCHNHPFGKSFPSREDLCSTAKLLSAGEILGINLLDHIIVSNSGYFSFLEHGLLNKEELVNR